MKGYSIWWIVALIVVVGLAIWSGWWALAVIARVILYVVLALIAIDAIVMIARKGRHDSGRTPLAH